MSSRRANKLQKHLYMSSLEAVLGKFNNWHPKTKKNIVTPGGINVYKQEISESLIIKFIFITLYNLVILCLRWKSPYMGL